MTSQENQPLNANEDFAFARKKQRIAESELTHPYGLTHECGVFGAIGDESWPYQNGHEIAEIICLGLEALQHRGQESAGVVVSSGTETFTERKGMGLVKHVFGAGAVESLKGHLGVGHTRYSTTSASNYASCQPFVLHSMRGTLAIAHNGELVNCGKLREMVLERGVGLSTQSDSELLAQALCLIPPAGEREGPNWPARIRHLMQLTPLSYSLVIMLQDRIYAVRDPFGNRPLCIGKLQLLDDTKTPAVAHLVSSESCAFKMSSRLVREVLPGEIVELSRTGVRTVDVVTLPAHKNLAFCIFEYVYFARPHSVLEGQEVYRVRQHCGAQLAVEKPVEADVVGSVPESGNAAAYGFSRQLGIPFAEVLCKNNFVGRTFIQPTHSLRQHSVNLKYSAIPCNVRGQRVVLVDDSIVRGNTMGPIVRLLRDAGATEVHIRVASPPLRHPCYMGINIPTRSELIANQVPGGELAEYVGADSLEYLTVEGLVKAVKKDVPFEQKTGHCTACLTGVYPEELSW